jgi:hypothetical protein
MTTDASLLLDETRAYLARFCSLPSDAALDTVTLWVAHTHAVDISHRLVFETTPRLAILSNGPASGKTRLLELVQRLSANGVQVADPTGPAVVSLIDEEHATVCIDEIDMLFGPGNGQRAVRTVLNTGYRVGAKIPRAGKIRDCFGPVALAGMAQNFRTSTALRPTFTRSIVVNMRPASACVDYRERLHGQHGRALNAALTAWGASRAAALATAWPALPEGVTGRLADIWEPLVAIGEVAGGEWGERARRACMALALSDVDGHEEAVTPASRMLEALGRVFMGATELTTAVILERLAILPGCEFRWPSPRTGAMELSAMLKPLGVGPVKLWVADEGRALQGYRWADIAPLLPEWPAEVAAEDDAELADIV